MSSVLEKSVKKLNLDRSDWRLVKFGDIAIQQKQSVDRENTHLKHYVKGEHMSSEDLHLREWGELDDEYLGPAFIRYFEKGDILYGSRRTYLRKVTIAPFEGITSNTTFVIKASEEIIEKPLLPFVMLSEGFSQHSIKNSKGSVNPYVNWKDLASYEFLLPPKDQQAEIFDLLWAMDNVIQKEDFTLNRLKILVESIIEKNLVARSCEGKLEDYCEPQGIKIGPFGSLLHASDYQREGVSVVMPADIENGKIQDDKVSKISPEKAKELGNYRLKKGDILFPRRGDLTKRAIVLSHQEGWICGTGTIRARLQENINPKAVFHAVNSNSTNNWLERFAVGTTMPNLNVSTISKIPLKIPTGKKADQLFQSLENALNSAKILEEKVDSSRSLQKSLINQVF